ncbi:MAG TPA: hypothetical protein PKE37_13095 [Thiomonas arsenitoxydans]|uniref:hypothetical protein n=1 Tax=Thiomonas sp. UBA7699 TaxID=1947694 RepID=UPI00257B58F7|nr:hypothetical protein [Thiomonas sp. UBA7699]HML82693.1 hypothetical protein [Thiomonas arsenitoxydans]
MEVQVNVRLRYSVDQQHVEAGGAKFDPILTEFPQPRAGEQLPLVKQRIKAVGAIGFQM